MLHPKGMDLKYIKEKYGSVNRGDEHSILFSVLDDRLQIILFVSFHIYCQSKSPVFIHFISYLETVGWKHTLKSSVRPSLKNTF